MPDQREKEGLLRETWQTAQTLLHDRRFSDEDALEYAALTVAGGMLYVHPFVDGNGRTSCVLSYMIAKGAEPESETLFGCYREVRADFIRRYLQAIVSEVPVGRRIKVPVGERGEFMENEIVKRAIDGLLLPRDQQAAEHRAYSDVHHR